MGYNISIKKILFWFGYTSMVTKQGRFTSFFQEIVIPDVWSHEIA